MIMSNVALKWARAVQPSDICSAAVLLFLADSHNEKTGLCFPSKAAIASYLHCDIRTVERALKTLRSENVVVWKTQKTKSGKCNFYYFVGLNFSRGVTTSNGVTPRNGVTSFGAGGLPHEMGVRVPSSDEGITRNITENISCTTDKISERRLSETQTSSSAKPMTTEQSADLFGYQENSNQTQIKTKKTRPPCPPCPYEKIVDLYHRTLPELPMVVALNASRKANMQARWRECYKDEDFNTEDEGLREFEYVFQKIRASNFLMGKVQQGDRPPFRASIDFIFKSTNFLKIIEDYYADKEKQNN